MARAKKVNKDNVVPVTTPVTTPETTTVIPPVPSVLPTVVVGLDTVAMRAIGLLASSALFNSPVHAKDANPSSVAALADVFAKYIAGSISLTATGPTAPVTATEKVASPTFG